MVILNEAKPKYERLDEILEDKLVDIRFSNQVNIIVDVKELVKKFFRPDIELYENHQLVIEEIASDILNIISHYRNYFYKKNKYTTFYFLYSFKKCENLLSIMENYKKEYYEKYFNESDPKTKVVKNAIKVVEKVISLIPNAFFIETSEFDEYIYTKYIHEIITKENELTLILSNDDLLYQLINKSTFGLTLKGIKSDLVNQDNCFNILTKKDNIELKSEALPLVLSIGGNKKDSFKGIPSVALSRAIKITSYLKAKELVVNFNTVEFPLEFSKLNEKSKMEKMLIDNRDTLLENYKLIKGDEIMYKNKLLISNKFVFTKKVATKKYFLELNSKIFTSYPLQLDMMLRGELK